jgi:tRNA A37 threonylcarbamoyladenosine dehydratase
LEPNLIDVDDILRVEKDQTLRMLSRILQQHPNQLKFKAQIENSSHEMNPPNQQDSS